MSNAPRSKYASEIVRTMGAKYVQGRDVAEIAKCIRADIAAAVKAGEIPAVKVSVRVSRYSMGQSVNVTISAVPAGFPVLNPARVRADIERPHDYNPIPRLSALASFVVDEVEAIALAYQRAETDTMADYRNANFALSVDFSGDVESADRARVAAAPASRAA